MQARTLDDCLNADDAMARLAAHAARLQQLQQVFVAAVPAAMARASRVANYKAGVVIIHAENGAVAAKLRQLAPSLTAEFRQRGQEVTEIRIKVQPLDAALQQTHTPVAAVLGAASRASIERLAGDLPDGPLRDSLRRFMQKVGKIKPAG